jgi:hypothetical protein
MAIMLEKLRKSASLDWLRTAKTAPPLEAETAGGVEKVYRVNHTTPRVLVVVLCLIVAVPVAGSLLVSPQTSSDMSSVLAVVFGMIAFLDVVLIVLVGLFPFFFPHPLDEVRIRGRVITVRRRWQEHSFWLGDAARLVWVCKGAPPRVHLLSTEADFLVPLASLRRADSVELFEWLRWGSSVADEQWPEFCHKIALPRRGPIDRPLRECERLRTRRGWDLLLVYLAGALGVAGAIGMAWTGQARWFAPLWMIPALWMWRFTIPRQGEIVVRSPLGPKSIRMSAGLAALLAGSAVIFPFTQGDKQELITMWSMVLLMVLGFSACAVAFGIYAEQEKYTTERTPEWIGRAVAVWNAEAKSGAWAILPEKPPTFGAIGASDF